MLRCEYPGCTREARYVERDMETKKVLRRVCLGHACSLNPYTEFVSIAELEKELLAELETLNPYFSRYTPVARLDKLSPKLP